MSTPQERLYELALGGIDGQRQALVNARSAVPPLIAVALGVAGVVAKPAFAHAGAANTAFAVLGALGTALVLVFGVLTFAEPTTAVVVGFSIDDLAAQTESLIDDSNAFHLALAKYLDQIRTRNEFGVNQIRRRLFLALLGLVLEAGGLVFAAAVHF